MVALAKDNDERLGLAVHRRIQAQEFDVPMLPKTTAEILAVLRDADISAEKLSRLIHRDPTLAAHVLRIANSPAYRGRAPIVSLQQAVARMGLLRLTEVTVAASLGAKVFKVPGHEERVKEIWSMALVTALSAKEIARFDRRNVENAFLCGLLHSIGEPVILLIASEEWQRLAGAAGSKLPKTAIDALMKAYAAPVGAMVAREWSLPESVASAIAFHTQYESAENHVYEAMLTHFAKAFAQALAVHEGANDDDLVAKLADLPVVAELNLYPDDLRAVLGKSTEILRTAEAMSA